MNLLIFLQTLSRHRCISSCLPHESVVMGIEGCQGFFSSRLWFWWSVPHPPSYHTNNTGAHLRLKHPSHFPYWAVMRLPTKKRLPSSSVSFTPLMAMLAMYLSPPPKKKPFSKSLQCLCSSSAHHKSPNPFYSCHPPFVGTLLEPLLPSHRPPPPPSTPSRHVLDAWFLFGKSRIEFSVRHEIKNAKRVWFEFWSRLKKFLRWGKEFILYGYGYELKSILLVQLVASGPLCR